jgi:hypothetical protein
VLLGAALGAVYGVLRARQGLAQDYEQEQGQRFNKAYALRRKKRRGETQGHDRERERRLLGVRAYELTEQRDHGFST